MDNHKEKADTTDLIDDTPPCEHKHWFITDTMTAGMAECRDCGEILPLWYLLNNACERMNALIDKLEGMQNG